MKSSRWSQNLIDMLIILKRWMYGAFIFCAIIFLLMNMQTTNDSASGGLETATAIELQLQQQQQLQPSAKGSKPNQIQQHEPSREPLSGNPSSIYNLSYSLDKASTLAPTPTAADGSSASSQATPIIPVSSSSSSADAQQLIDLHNFAYLMEQPDCEAHILILILVHTAPRNTEKRSLIRQTWGTPHMTQGNSPLRLVFLLGAVPSDAAIQHELEQENERYADMVQGNFQDAYRNMTYKHVMALKWFNQHCAHAQLLIKVDDDVFVNTPQLLKLFRDPVANSNSSLSVPLRNLLQQHHELLFCRPELNSLVRRSYRVSMQNVPNVLHLLTATLSLSLAVQVACQLQGVPRTLLPALLSWLCDYLLSGCGAASVPGSSA